MGIEAINIEARPSRHGGGNKETHYFLETALSTYKADFATPSLTPKSRMAKSFNFQQATSRALSNGNTTRPAFSSNSIITMLLRFQIRSKSESMILIGQNFYLRNFIGA